MSVLPGPPIGIPVKVALAKQFAYLPAAKALAGRTTAPPASQPVHLSRLRRRFHFFRNPVWVVKYT